MSIKNKLCSANLIYFYIAGVADGSKMQIDVIDTGHYLPDGFYERAKTIYEEFDNYSDGIELFGVIGSSEKVEYVKDKLRTELKNNFERILNNEDLMFLHPDFDASGNASFKLVQEYFCRHSDAPPAEFKIEENGWTLYCIHKLGENFSQYAESALLIWLDAEQPMFFGKQLMIRSFLFRDLIGRKVMGNVPNYEESVWNVIFEGGVKLPIGADSIFTGEKIDHDALNQLSISQIDAIINNPSYAYGEIFLPVSSCLQWYKTFMYSCVVSEIEWSEALLLVALDDFVAFLKAQICETVTAPPIIEKGLFVGAALNKIKNMRKLLQGEETIVISKDIIQQLRSRYVYLPYMYELINDIEKAVPKEYHFNKTTLNALIDKADATKTDEKGAQWENVAEYFVNNIPGLKVVGKRVKTRYQEIDLSVVNVSTSEKLWKFGAYILVECKNWKRKVDIPVIRNLAYTSMMRGNTTIFLFAANGVTRDAYDEIMRLTTQDIFVLVITKEDLFSCAEEKIA